jgi:hypothetical protein
MASETGTSSSVTDHQMGVINGILDILAEELLMPAESIPLGDALVEDLGLGLEQFSAVEDAIQDDFGVAIKLADCGLLFCGDQVVQAVEEALSQSRH